jgi:hypothetical protein
MQPRGLSAIGTLFAFIMILVLLGILWVATGGPSRPISHAGPFLTAPTVPGVNLRTGQTTSGGESQGYGSSGSSQPQSQNLWDIFFTNHGGVSSGAQGDSRYSSAVSLEASQTSESDPAHEYITLRISGNATSSFTISGWTLENKQKAIRVTLGSAAETFSAGDINSQTPVTVGPGGTVYIVTGRSPNGASFRTNKCIGYLEQFQDYQPSLNRNCPLPQDEGLLNSGKTSSSGCIDFLDQLGQCEVYTDTLPDTLDSSCKDFIKNDLTYNGCVSRHRNDPDFYANEWHLYLNRDQDLWSDTHDQVLLWDENGKLISSVTY